MISLAATAPEVHQEFLKGGFAVQITNNRFSAVWTDMALEQTMDKQSKSNGGIIGFSLNPNARDRWFLSNHIRAGMVESLKGMVVMDTSWDDTDFTSGHKEDTETRMEADERGVSNLLDILRTRMKNPFSISPLCNVATGYTLADTQGKVILNVHNVGCEAMMLFTEERFNANEPEPLSKPITEVKIPKLMKAKGNTATSTQKKLKMIN
jgi:hypothetical protein